MAISLTQMKARQPNWAVNLFVKIFFPNADLSQHWVTLGNRVYGPVDCPPDIWAHEHVHMRQQRNGWLTIPFCIAYVTSKRFRYKMELEAYRVHLDYLASKKPQHYLKYRQRIAEILSSEVYGHMVRMEQAYVDLKPLK